MTIYLHSYMKIPIGIVPNNGELESPIDKS